MVNVAPLMNASHSLGRDDIYKFTNPQIKKTANPLEVAARQANLIKNYFIFLVLVDFLFTTRRLAVFLLVVILRLAGFLFIVLRLAGFFLALRFVVFFLAVLRLTAFFLAGLRFLVAAFFLAAFLAFTKADLAFFSCFLSWSLSLTTFLYRTAATIAFFTGLRFFVVFLFFAGIPLLPNLD